MIQMKLDQVGVSFSNKTVLKSVSGTFKGGELVSVIGPNGTGKNNFDKSDCQFK